MIKLPSPVGSFEDRMQIFDYSHEPPINIEEKGVDNRGNITIHDISYASPAGGKIRAYLVQPPDKDPFAGVISIHPGRSHNACKDDLGITADRCSLGLCRFRRAYDEYD